MGYFPVRSDSRVIIYERKMFIRLATGVVQFKYFTYRLVKLKKDTLSSLLLLLLVMRSETFLRSG